jgi:hypothetical protein
MANLEVKHYKVLKLPDKLTPNVVYYVLDKKSGKVKTYISDLNGIPIPLLDLTAAEINGAEEFERKSNKQNSLDPDGTGLRYVTVDAVRRSIDDITSSISDLELNLGTPTTPLSRVSDGTETNWDIVETITSAHILFINGLKIVRGEDYTVLGSVYTFTGYYSEAGHVQESYSGSILVGSGGGGGFPVLNLQNYRSTYVNPYIYTGYLLESVITITRTQDGIKEYAQSLTDLELDWNNKEALTYIES